MTTPFFFSIFGPIEPVSCRRHFLLKDFDGFDREVWPKTHFVSLTQYDVTYPSPFIFAPAKLSTS